MYSESANIYRTIFKFVILAVVLQISVQLFSQIAQSSSAILVGTIFTWASLLFITLLEMLQPDVNYTNDHAKNLIGFSIRFGFVGLLISIPAIIVSILVFANRPAEMSSGGAFLATYIAGQIVLIILMPVLLPFIGLVLPSYVKTGQQNFLFAFKHGKRQFWKIALQIFRGPAFLYMVATIIPLASLGLYRNGIVGVNWQPNWPYIGVLIISYLILAYAVVMLTWILSKAYNDAEKHNNARVKPN